MIFLRCFSVCGSVTWRHLLIADIEQKQSRPEPWRRMFSIELGRLVGIDWRFERGQFELRLNKFF